MNNNVYKCPICGKKYKTNKPIDFKYFDLCPDCKEIIELQKIIKLYSDTEKYKMFKAANKIITSVDDNTDIKVSYSINETYLVQRPDQVSNIINKIKKARNFLYFDLGPQINILYSLLNEKDVFWAEGGNLKYFIFKSTIQYIIIKLKELINGSNSKISITTLLNTIEKDKITLYDKQKIYRIITNDKTKKFEEVLFDTFPIIDYINSIKNVLNSYEEILNCIKDIRDKECAHLERINETNLSKLQSFDIRRIYNSIKIIYDGLYFSLAPDLYDDREYDPNICISHLNNIVEFWNNNHKKL